MAGPESPDNTPAPDPASDIDVELQLTGAAGTELAQYRAAQHLAGVVADATLEFATRLERRFGRSDF